SCKQEIDDPYKELYNTYEQYSKYCNGHNTSTKHWTLYVNLDTPDSIITVLEKTYIVEKRANQQISIDNLNDIALGYFSISSTWSVIEKNEVNIKVITPNSTNIESTIILNYIEDGLIIIEYSDAELVLNNNVD